MGSAVAGSGRRILFSIVALAAAASVFAGTTNLVAVDALGRTVGKVRSINPTTGSMDVEIQLNREALRLRIAGDVFTHASRPLVYYEAADCTGVPYMTVAESTAVPGEPVAVAGVHQTLYRGNAQRPESRTLKSAMWTESCKSVDLQIEVMAATPVLDLGFEFLPPYRAVHRAGRTERRQPTPDGGQDGGLQRLEGR
jgi:hypothetical protein